jgi:hypothetical protein
MYVYEKVRARNFGRAWGYIQERFYSYIFRVLLQLEQLETLSEKFFCQLIAEPLNLIKHGKYTKYE